MGGDTASEQIRLPFGGEFINSLNRAVGRPSGIQVAATSTEPNAGFQLGPGESTFVPVSLRDFSSLLSGVKTAPPAPRIGVANQAFRPSVGLGAPAAIQPLVPNPANLAPPPHTLEDLARILGQHPQGMEVLQRINQVCGTQIGNVALLQELGFYVAKSRQTPVSASTLGGGVIGSGNVTGPNSSTDNAVARYDGTSGQLIQDSGLIVDDSVPVTGYVVHTPDPIGSLAEALVVRPGDPSGVATGAGAKLTLKGGAAGTDAGFSGGDVDILGGSHPTPGGSTGQVNIGTSQTAAVTVGAVMSTTSGRRLTIFRTSADVTLTSANDVVIVTGLHTITLEASPLAGQRHIIRNAHSAAITISGNGNSINVAGSFTLSVPPGAGVELEWDSTGSIWWVTLAAAGNGGLADPGSNGLVARTALGVTAARTITPVPGEGLAVSNGNGVSADPTVRIDPSNTDPATVAAADSLFIADADDSKVKKAALSGMKAAMNVIGDPGGNGIVVRTAAQTSTNRSIAVAGAGNQAGLAISNGDGVSANPTLGLDVNNMAAGSGGLALADRLPVYRNSVSANRYLTGQEILDGIGALASATPTLSNVLPIYTTVAKNMSIQNFYDLINSFTASTPILTSKLAGYLASASAARSFTANDILKLIDSMTPGTPLLSSKLAGYLASASDIRSFTPQNILDLLNSLTEDTAPDGANDFLLSYDTSASAAKKVKPDNLPVPGVKITYVTADEARTNATPTDSIYLIYNMAANTKYKVTGLCFFNLNVVATGLKFGFNIPVATISSMKVTAKLLDGTGYLLVNRATGSSTFWNTAGTANTNFQIEIDGTIEVGGTGGNFAIIFSRSIGSGTTTLQRNSYLEFSKIT